MMSDVLDHHHVFESFRNIYGVSVILRMLLKMYVQYFPVAGHLICVVLAICAAPGDLDPSNVFGRLMWDTTMDRSRAWI